MTKPSEITLQINSVEAVERLIGGDETMELSLRNSIVQEFAKRHLKAIANDVGFKRLCIQIVDETKGAIQHAKEEITEAVSKAADEEFGTWERGQ